MRPYWRQFSFAAPQEMSLAIGHEVEEGAARADPAEAARGSMPPAVVRRAPLTTGIPALAIW